MESVGFCGSCSVSNGSVAQLRSEFLGCSIVERRQAVTAGRKPRTKTVVAVFDFLRKGGEQVKKSAAKTGGNVIDYVKKRAQEDIAKVNAFNEGLRKSREKLSRDLTGVLSNLGTSAELEQALEGLEEVLITSDLGIDTVDAVMEDLRKDAKRERLRDEADVRASLKSSLVGILESKVRHNFSACT